MSAAANRQSRAQYWQTQINAWKASGQSQRAFCEVNGLNYANFGYWSRKLRGNHARHEERPTSAFVPVTLRSASGNSGLRLVLPNGVKIRGIAQSDLALAGQLVERLS